MNTMHDINPIKIFKGDDTDFNGGKWLTINLTTDLDLTGFIGVFTLDKFKVTKSAASKSIDLVIPRSFTSKMAVGEYAGVFQLIDTNGRYLTVTNTIPFQVTQEVFTPQGDEINLQVPENYPVEISLSIYGGAVDYDKLANLPTFNGKEWRGPLTFESENIAPKSELDALAGKVNTNKNDIDGLGDQIHEVEAKIPSAASETNQLADKAFVNAEMAKNQAALDLKADKSDTYTKTEVDTFVAEQETNLTTVKNDLGDLGDQVSVIEAKIPQAASENNQLADKQFVQDLTSALNFVKWVDTLPETGESKYIYAVPREETDTDGKQIAALYLWDGSAWRGAGAFSLNIDPATLATKSELAGYLPLTGGTLSGDLKVKGNTDFTGTLTAVTPNAGDNSQKVATTAFVNSAIANAPVDGGVANNGFYEEKDLGTWESVADVEAFLSTHKVSTGKFGSLKLGNYVTIKDGTYNKKWAIAGFDIHLSVGDTALNTHHIALFPKNNLLSARMNETNTTAGGYAGSEMHTVTIPAVVENLQTVLGTHLLKHRRLLSNSVSTSAVSGAGAGWTGSSNGWAWEDVYACLLTEPQLYGTRSFSSGAYDVGEGAYQLPLFRFISHVKYSRDWFWLRAVAGSAGFCIASGDGGGTYSGASYSYGGVRPLILIG